VPARVDNVPKGAAVRAAATVAIGESLLPTEKAPYLPLLLRAIEFREATDYYDLGGQGNRKFLRLIYICCVSLECITGSRLSCYAVLSNLCRLCSAKVKYNCKNFSASIGEHKARVVSRNVKTFPYCLFLFQTLSTPSSLTRNPSCTTCLLAPTGSSTRGTRPSSATTLSESGHTTRAAPGATCRRSP
jgi:hypothetical protein